MAYNIALLPPQFDLESKAILKKAASAHRYLAELKGVATSIPNESILISTLVLQEARDSSAIENIITTEDELFRAELFEEFVGPAQKEVQNYAKALRFGFEKIRTQGLLTQNLSWIYNNTWRKIGPDSKSCQGTTLKNQQTGDVVTRHHKTTMPSFR
ncbi:MAG: Fic/DOC family N-terminal domain-containing protein [Saprospiraceae bacterium]